MPIILANANFEQYSKNLFLHEDAVLTTINRTLSTCKTNYATEEDNLTVIGSLTFDKGAICTSKSNYIRSDVSETAQMTVISIFKPITTNAYPICNYGGSSATAGVAISATDTQLRFWAGTDSGVQQVALSVSPLGTWQFIAGVANATNNTIYNLKNNVSATVVRVGNRVTQSAKFNIGSVTGGAAVGQSEVFMTCVIDKALDKAEVDAIASMMRKYALQHNITV